MTCSMTCRAIPFHGRYDGLKPGKMFHNPVGGANIIILGVGRQRITLIWRNYTVQKQWAPVSTTRRTIRHAGWHEGPNNHLTR